MWIKYLKFKTSVKCFDVFKYIVKKKLNENLDFEDYGICIFCITKKEKQKFVKRFLDFKIMYFIFR